MSLYLSRLLPHLRRIVRERAEVIERDARARGEVWTVDGDAATSQSLLTQAKACEVAARTGRLHRRLSDDEIKRRACFKAMCAATKKNVDSAAAIAETQAVTTGA